MIKDIFIRFKRNGKIIEVSQQKADQMTAKGVADLCDVKGKVIETSETGVYVMVKKVVTFVSLVKAKQLVDNGLGFTCDKKGKKIDFDLSDVVMPVKQNIKSLDQRLHDLENKDAIDVDGLIADVNADVDAVKKYSEALEKRISELEKVITKLKKADK